MAVEDTDGLGRAPPARWRQWLFLGLFIGIYAVFHYSYFAISDDVLRDVVYHKGIVTISRDLINLLAPIEQVQGIQNRLLSARANLEIVRGCDGAGAIFLVLAAVLAFSANWKNKVVGVLAGFVLMYTINLCRIVGLYFIVAYKRDWFLPVHTYFAPTLIVLLGCLFFAWWAMWSTRVPLNEPTTPA